MKSFKCMISRFPVYEEVNLLKSVSLLIPGYPQISFREYHLFGISMILTPQIQDADLLFYIVP